MTPADGADAVFASSVLSYHEAARRFRLACRAYSEARPELPSMQDMDQATEALLQVTLALAAELGVAVPRRLD